VEGYGVGFYDPSKVPVMAFYKYSSETSASLIKWGIFGQLGDY